MNLLNMRMVLKWLFFAVLIYVEISCQIPTVSTNHQEVFHIGGANIGLRTEPRKVIDPKLIANRLSWAKECVSEKTELLCWLENKDKVPQIKDTDRLLIQQGPTSSFEIQVVVSLPKTERAVIVRLFDRKTKQLFEPLKIRETEREFSDTKNILVYFEKLQADKKYELIVAGSDGKLFDEREVLTLPLKLKALKFAVVSCANDFLYSNGGAEMWDDLWSMAPHFILEIGDNSYADMKNGKPVRPNTEQNIWERYLETRGMLSIYRKHQLVPIIALWDDHDYGSNDGDRTFEIKDKSLQIFKDMFAQDDVSGFFQNGPGVSSTMLIAGQRFLLMDDRYYRSVNQVPPVLAKINAELVVSRKPDILDYETHFGKEGESFIFDKLNHDSVPTWLVSGDQFFGAYQIFESYEANQPKSFKTFLNSLKKAKAKVVFVSGDRHLSELMEIDKQEVGYHTYEVTSSGIHAAGGPEAWARDRNPRQLAGVSGVYNYTIIESEVKKNKLGFKLTAYKANKTKLYEKTLKLGE